MSEPVSVQVVGAEMLAATLGRAMAELRTMAPDAVGDTIRDRARAAAPYVTGRLRSSLHAETADGRVSVGSDLIYAPVIHNGWPAHHIAADPFLIPVAEETESAWGRAYLVETNKILSQVRGA